jgi:hypothetical protein
VVSTVGETTCDPLNATGVPFKSAFTQFTVFQASVELAPGRMQVGFALIPAPGGPLEPSVTVAVAVAVVPVELLAIKV